MTTFRIAQVRIGTVRPFGPQGRPSAIDKQPVSGPVAVMALGLAGDEQGDPKHHGGPDKAVHAYPLVHYARWAAELPVDIPNLHPGGFGENLVTEGIAEAGMCLGDLWRVGTALMQVSQARQPCWKLNLRFAVPDMSRRVQDSERSGWYFRVLEPGIVAAGDEATLVERPQPQWSLDRVSRLLYRDRLNRDALAEFVALPSLPDRWRQIAQARLDSRQVEDWSARLNIPNSEA